MPFGLLLSYAVSWQCENNLPLIDSETAGPVFIVTVLPRPRQGGWVLFSIDFLFIYLFVSLFLCQQDYEKTAGPICVTFSGMVTMGRLIQFRVNSGKLVGGLKVTLLSPNIAIWFDCCLLAVLCCHLVIDNVN